MIKTVDKTHCSLWMVICYFSWKLQFDYWWKYFWYFQKLYYAYVYETLYKKLFTNLSGRDKIRSRPCWQPIVYYSSHRAFLRTTKQNKFESWPKNLNEPYVHRTMSWISKKTYGLVKRIYREIRSRLSTDFSKINYVRSSSYSYDGIKYSSRF